MGDSIYMRCRGLGVYESGSSSEGIEFWQTPGLHVVCREKERDRDHFHPYKVIEITPPPKNLGIRCFPPNMQCGESVTIEGQAYTISSVTHCYQLRKGKYEPSEKRLDVLSIGRYILNLYLESMNQAAVSICSQYKLRCGRLSASIFVADHPFIFTIKEENAGLL
ncbi:hypothetical protein K2173_014894 [Erythroxylum novogranatense]|uniref:Uncharacterized protein n=1 Tax=Erythroxylum novogranatense TaxID=1862640 RepID=A0AAV8TFW7_9ROSI|nr:hypothetical protein K2173_014894 [Erythroxylum novogranatense]